MQVIHALYDLLSYTSGLIFRKWSMGLYELGQITSIAIFENKVIRVFRFHSIDHCYYIRVVGFFKNQDLVFDILELIIADSIPL